MKWNETHLFNSEAVEHPLRKVGLPENTIVAMTEQAWRNWSDKSFGNWRGTTQLHDGKRVYATSPIKTVTRIAPILDVRIAHVLARR